MTLLPTLPQVDVYIAFNVPSVQGAFQQALPSPGTSNAYWKNVSSYVIDYTISGGRQHYSDRPSPTTLKLTMNGRDGFFFNPAVSGTGFVIGPRMPIAVTTTVAGVTNLKFWGLIDSANEKPSDQLNVVLDIEASDFTKYLSQRYANVPTFWPTYANTTNTAHWYRFTRPTIYTVTGATNTSTTSVVYTCAGHGFGVGDEVTVSGLSPTVTGSQALNYANITITATTTNTFTATVPTLPSGTFYAAGQGSGYKTALFDSAGSVTGDIVGIASWNNAGVLAYDIDQSIDLGAGMGSTASAHVQLPIFTGAGGLDFWILGGNMAGSTILTIDITDSGSVTQTLTLSVNSPDGHLIGTNVTASTSVSSSLPINDGYWHHIGLVQDASNNLQMWCDGALYAIPSTTTNGSGFNSHAGAVQTIGSGTPCYLDELIVMNNSGTTRETDLKNRYTAGTLLQQGYPLQTKYATDRIAELLVLVGYGAIVNGVANPNTASNVFYVYDTPTTTGPYTPGTVYGPTLITGTPGALVQGYYWDTPVSGMTILDLIQQQADTDVGIFTIGRLIGGVPAFYFQTQNYWGTWAWTASTNTGTWTPNTANWAGNAILADDGTNHPYEVTSLEIARDAEDLWTSVKITPQSGYDQTYPISSNANEVLWGMSTLIKSSTMHPSNNAALNTAAYLSHLFRSPLPRVKSVTISSVTANGTNTALISSTYPNDILWFRRTAPNASTTGTYPSTQGYIDQPMVVESFTETFTSDPGEYSATYTLDPYPLRS